LAYRSLRAFSRLGRSLMRWGSKSASVVGSMPPLCFDVVGTADNESMKLLTFALLLASSFCWCGAAV